MSSYKNLLFIKNQDKTESVIWCKYDNGKYKGMYDNCADPYNYAYNSILWLRNPIEISTVDHQFFACDTRLYDIISAKF